MKNGIELNKTAIAIGKVIKLLDVLEKKIIYDSDIYENKEDIYFIAYYARVAIVDRIKSNYWSTTQVLYIPLGFLRNRKETIGTSLMLTIDRLVNIAERDVLITDHVENILIKGELFYEYEKILPDDFKKSI